MTTDAKWSDFSNLDAERLLIAGSRILPKWVALAFVVGIAWQLAKLVWLMIPDGEGSAMVIEPPVQVAGSGGAADAGIDVQAIAASHIFGKAEAQAAVVEPQESHENLSETRLSLTLKGTIASPQNESSIAIIADARNEEKVYVLRDTVTQGVTLHAIYADRVVLNRAGALEVLKLPKEFPQGSSGSMRNVTSVSRAADSSQSIQEVVAQNVTQLADVIRPTPYYVSGVMQGYRVYPGRDRKQFAALGLRPGDLIKDIDGAALANPQQATEIFQSLGDKDQVSVTVERNGQPEVLILRTSQLELDDTQ